MIQLGREMILTDEQEITYDNIVPVLMKALPRHERNAKRCKFLLDYEAGWQPLRRKVKKTYRADIDWENQDNLAHEVVLFWTSFQYGHVPFFIQRDETRGMADIVESLNFQYTASGHKKETQNLGRYIEICGIGHTYIDINREWEDGEAYFTRDVLSPMTTFVMYSGYYTDKRPMMGVTFRRSETGNIFFTCFTTKGRFEVVRFYEPDKPKDERFTWFIREEEKNFLDRIPIIEWSSTSDRMGLFEREIPTMDNINLLLSDLSNQTDQNTNVIFWGNNVDLPTITVIGEDGKEHEVTKKPGSNDWLLTHSQPGADPLIKPLIVDYDYGGTLKNITTQRSLCLARMKVPQRNDNSGGSTGIAMSDATGWSEAETVAAMKQDILDGFLVEELKVVLSAIRENPMTKEDDPLLGLRYSDVEPNTARSKQYELTNKVNSAVTLLSHGFALEDVVETVHLFENPGKVIARSGDTVKKYQDTIYTSESEPEGGEDEPRVNAERIMQDYSDQTENSLVLP